MPAGVWESKEYAPREVEVRVAVHEQLVLAEALGQARVHFLLAHLEAGDALGGGAGAVDRGRDGIVVIGLYHVHV